MGERVSEVEVGTVDVTVDVFKKLSTVVVTVTVELAATVPSIVVLVKNRRLVLVTRESGIVATGSPLIDTVSGPVYVLVVTLVEVMVVVGRV